jgi:hypothetical protein
MAEIAHALGTLLGTNSCICIVKYRYDVQGPGNRKRVGKLSESKSLFLHKINRKVLLIYTSCRRGVFDSSERLNKHQGLYYYYYY